MYSQFSQLSLFLMHPMLQLQTILFDHQHQSQVFHSWKEVIHSCLCFGHIAAAHNSLLFLQILNCQTRSYQDAIAIHLRVQKVEHMLPYVLCLHFFQAQS